MKTKTYYDTIKKQILNCLHNLTIGIIVYAECLWECLLFMYVSKMTVENDVCECWKKLQIFLRTSEVASYKNLHISQ